jgi:hypothetical protein
LDTRLVRMLGCLVVCWIKKKQYRGVLADREEDIYAPGTFVVLIIIAGEGETLYVRLDTRELANGSAKCYIVADEEIFDGEDCVLVGAS